MARIITAITIIFICILYRPVSKKLHGRDVFAPLSFFGFYFFLTRVPRLLVAEYNLYGAKSAITDAMVWKYLYVTLFFLICVLIGAKTAATTRIVINKKTNYVASCEINIKYSDINYHALFWVGIVCFLIGAFSRVYLITRSGGISFIWANLHERVSLLEGSGYIDYLSICITFGLAAIEICMFNTHKYRAIFVILLAIGAGLSIAFGARSPLMKMAFALIFVYWYCSPEKVDFKRFLRPKYLIAGIILVFALLILPTFRTSNFHFSLEILSDAIRDASKNIPSVFDQISYYDEDVFTFDYFKPSNFWFGKSYLGLFTAWIPRSFFPDKPPIDEGMYLRAIMKGYSVIPPMSVSGLGSMTVTSSIPFTTNGIMFANFGIIGTIIGGLLTGIIIEKQYKKMLVKDYMLEEVLLYQFMCTRLALTTKGIVELLMTIIVIKIICGTVYRLSGVKRGS